MAVLGQGIVLMVAGMGIVYLFLWVLIVISEKSSKFVARFDYVLPDETPKKPKRVAAAAESAEVASAAPAATSAARALAISG